MAINIPKIPTPRDMVEDVKNEFKDSVITPLIGQFGKKKLDIDTYRSKFLGGNARAYLFLCNIEFPGMQNALKSGLATGLNALSAPSVANQSSAISQGLIAGAASAIKTSGTSYNTSDFKYFVKATTLPESSVEETSTYFCGKQYKLASVRRTQDWVVSFLVNEDASVLKKFIEWNYMMENPDTGEYGKPSDYMTNQTVQLLGLDGSSLITYKLFNAWPKTIGAVTLDYAQNEFATVDITFTYQYHTVAVGNGEPGALEMMRKMGLSVGNTLLGVGSV